MCSRHMCQASPVILSRRGRDWWALKRILHSPVASAEEAVREADIVVTATTARAPILSGSWLQAGTHINAMGSNWHNRREVDDETVERSAVVAVDALDQARIEAGDLIMPAAA